jgi:hypothetical protein
MAYPALQVTDYLAHRHGYELTHSLFIVRRYVEGLPECAQLVDLLSAGPNSIEPTAAAGRPPLYPEVSSRRCPFILAVTKYGHELAFIHRCSHGGGQSRPIAPRAFQREPVQLFRGLFYS